MRFEAWTLKFQKWLLVPLGAVLICLGVERYWPWMNAGQFINNIRVVNAGVLTVHCPHSFIVIDVREPSQEAVPRVSKKREVLRDRTLASLVFVLYEPDIAEHPVYIREGYFGLGQTYRIHNLRIVARATYRVDDMRLARKILRAKPFDERLLNALLLTQHQKLLIRRDVDAYVPIRVVARPRDCSLAWVDSPEGPALDIEVSVDLIEFREIKPETTPPHWLEPAPKLKK